MADEIKKEEPSQEASGNNTPVNPSSDDTTTPVEATSTPAPAPAPFVEEDDSALFPDLAPYAGDTVESLRKEKEILQKQAVKMQEETVQLAGVLATAEKKITELQASLAQAAEDTKKAVSAVTHKAKSDNAQAVSQFVEAQLPILADIESVMNAITPEARAADADVARMAKSVDMTMTKLMDVFKKFSTKPETKPAEAVAAAPVETAAPAVETPATAAVATPAAPTETTSATPVPAVEAAPAADTVESLRQEKDQLLKQNVKLMSERSQMSLNVRTAKGKITTLEASLEKSAHETEKAVNRATIQAAEENKLAVAKFVKAQMPILDDIEFVMNAITAEARAADPDVDRMAKAVDATMAKLMGVFNTFGVKQINPLHQAFDDAKGHEAIGEDNDTTGLEAGTVTKVIQKGYEVNGEVIRTAKVIATPLY